MEKKLKNCYHCLDLPYSATSEQVEIREKAMIKIITAKAQEKHIPCENEVEEVKTSASLILENIKKNGIPNEEYHRFETSNESVWGLLIVFVFVAIICFFSFYILN